MKWRTGALRCNVQNMSNASELGQAVIEWYDEAESDFVQCQTKMRAFPSKICSEFKQIELN